MKDCKNTKENYKCVTKYSISYNKILIKEKNDLVLIHISYNFFTSILSFSQKTIV